ncbi:Protein transport protein SEC24 [Smittium culicis]|uniref:Protein transport protein SEC24 n=1 Tax=Smittium culicis TaxID=133412 RepID=A0A1R1Y5N8_9FUNG|nr:Protein transport protein SEC24 [Smittium culicis]
MINQNPTPPQNIDGAYDPSKRTGFSSPIQNAQPISNQFKHGVPQNNPMRPVAPSQQAGFGLNSRTNSPTPNISQNASPAIPNGPPHNPFLNSPRPSNQPRPSHPPRPVIHMPNSLPQNSPQQNQQQRILSPNHNFPNQNIPQNQLNYQQNFHNMPQALNSPSNRPPAPNASINRPPSVNPPMNRPPSTSKFPQNQKNFPVSQQSPLQQPQMTPPQNLSSAFSQDPNIQPNQHQKRRQYPTQMSNAYTNAPVSNIPNSIPRNSLPSQHSAKTANFPPTPNSNNNDYPIVGNDLFVPGDAKAHMPPPINRASSPSNMSDSSKQQYPNINRYPSSQSYSDPTNSSQNPQAPVDYLNNQMGSMNFGAMNQQTQISELVGHPPIYDIKNPTPLVKLPPGIPVVPSESHWCPPEHQRCTLYSIPKTDKLLKKSKLPFGLLVTPYLKQNDIPDPPTVTEIVRCRRCRAYINPYVSFIEGGRRWKCNLCLLTNDVPLFFDYDTFSQQPRDRWSRAELLNSVVEFVAPADYMVRPPMPPVYLFVIDVSFPAVQLGAPEIIGQTILEFLDKLPNDDERTKVAFITTDSALHFYTIKPDQADPQVYVVADFDSVFLPSPNDILVNLSECREGIKTLVSRLGSMYSKNTSVGNTLGPALLAAQKILNSIGGKVVVFQSSAPTVGDASINIREETKALGTPAESEALKPNNNWYKTFAADCSRVQIAFDMVYIGHQSMDSQTSVCLARFTGGSVFYYPTFMINREQEVTKFKTEMINHYSQRIGMEAVLRVRVSRGLKLTNYYGHFFLRSLDLLALPIVIPNHCYAIDVEIEETLTANTVYFQTALLHTSANGERRIRVITTAIPTTENIHNVFHHADQVAICALLAKKAVDRALTSKLEDAREALQYKLFEMLSSYKSECTQSMTGATTVMRLPKNLILLPFLMLSILKSASLRPGNTVNFGQRILAISQMITLSPEIMFNSIVVPKMYALVNGEDYETSIYPVYPTAEFLSYKGVFLLHDGQNVFLWIGKEADIGILHNLLGTDNIHAINSGVSILPVIESSPLNKYVNQLLESISAENRSLWSPTFYICKESGDPLIKMWMYQKLVLDRDPSLPSYQMFISEFRDKVNRNSF